MPKPPTRTQNQCQQEGPKAIPIPNGRIRAGRLKWLNDFVCVSICHVSISHRRDEPVPAPWQRLDKPRILRRVSKCFANTIDRAVEIVVDVDEGVGPKALLQFFPSDDCTRLLQQDCEYLEGLTAELELQSSFA